MGAKKKQVQPRSGLEGAFGSILRTRRKKIGLSQEQLAFDAGFDRTTINLMERGLLSPTLRTMGPIVQIVEAFASQLAKQIEESEFF